MSDLHLDSLEIKNFRCFEHLVIPKLGRVNLIVGKNSVGKTCLLEALLLYATNGDFSVIQKILSDRKELTFLDDSPVMLSRGIDYTYHPETVPKLLRSINFIFFNRRLILNSTKASIKSKLVELVFGLSYSNSFGSKEEPESIDTDDSFAVSKLLRNYHHIIWRVGLKALPNQGYTENFVISLIPENRLRLVFLNRLIERHTLFIPQQSLSLEEIENLWSRISLTDAENNVISALKTVNKDIERIGFVGETTSTSNIERYPVVKIRGRQEPVPLRQLGEGASRALGLALALANASNGYVLIDEFETGLHHSVQVDIWRMIFETAKRLNIQVFATTHSWDCVEAFQQAAAEDQNEEAMLIRLQRKRDGTGIEAISYDERRLAVATRQSVEVR